MDIRREIDLKNFYREIPELQLLGMLSEDEKNFEDVAYELLVEEAKRRGLEDKLAEIRSAKEKQKEEIIMSNAEKKHEVEKRQNAFKFVTVFTTPKSVDIPIIKSILESQNIPYHIKGEHFGSLYGYTDGFSSMDVMVREDHSEVAKELLKEFITPT